MTGLHAKVAAILLLILLASGATWKVQDWRYGKQLAAQAGLHQDDLAAISNVAAAQVRVDQEKRQALEQRLSASDQAHYEKLTHAQKDQTRLRDRLATADLRLSVLLDATDTARGCALPTTATTRSVVHGSQRAQLDPAHAQRIIGITGEGDQGLIALRACQNYLRAVSMPK
ncbi:Bacteriophage Rz lysis protein [Pseudomonas sp. ok272]|uniref:lysis system i-spanin subunit Rz n=1 Tax=unclassified Pseudomonas TaxID=196821 RepID=UPI0008B8318E|nr:MULTISPECIES: lysis system i-spanin subunit Rz [unclassified Pseudomonas]SEN18560.1 Bacteriophage Rz lysis protein [Pseudomonas sp. ok272]SFN10524.1 Bacteriophage Rz lysis protein [Pseudomonas sp. ok602]